jgi:hypothetical protein
VRNRACQPQGERGLKAAARYQHFTANETAPNSPNPRVYDTGQSKTVDVAGLTECGRKSPLAVDSSDGFRYRDQRHRRQEMETSSVKKMLLGTAIAASIGIGYAIGAQPHMTETITLLQSARAELAAATPNKGGHRERALGLIDQAIGEVRAGIAFAGG